MLILSRNTDETIRIGDEIFVTVLGVKGKQVRIGIDAPRGIGVHREEVYQQILQKEGAGVPDEKARQIELAYQQHQAALAGGDA